MRKILCIMLVALPSLAPAAAEGRITARKAPSALACGAVLKLGVSARNHHGSRRVKVRIYTGTRLVYKRTVSAPKRWNKRLACGRRYRVVYRLPSGRKITRRIRVLAVGNSLPAAPALPETNSGSDQSPLTPAEQTMFAQMDAQADAQEACDAADEAHEDDENYEPQPCPGSDDEPGGPADAAEPAGDE
jgi:hypothetical protein